MIKFALHVFDTFVIKFALPVFDTLSAGADEANFVLRGNETCSHIAKGIEKLRFSLCLARVSTSTILFIESVR